MSRWIPLTHALALGLVWGCGPTVVVDQGDESGDEGSTQGVPMADSSGGTTAVPPPPGDTTSGVTPSETSTGEEVPFIEDPDGGVLDIECSTWEQDCLPGDKCMPWANDGGGVWNATRCSPIVEDPGEVGDPCTVTGSITSGIDDCELGAMCFYVNPRTLEGGTCVALCRGDETSPQCEPPDTACIPSSNLPLCLPRCDVLMQDCPEGQACHDVGEDFVCVPYEPGPGAPGQSCAEIAACDPGNFCAQAEVVPDCMSPACCTPYCQTDDPMPPCLPGQICVPYYEKGEAPPGSELLGACVLP